MANTGRHGQQPAPEKDCGLKVVHSMIALLASKYKMSISDTHTYIVRTLPGKELFVKFVKEELSIDIEPWEWIVSYDHGSGMEENMLGSGWILKESPELTKLLLEQDLND